MAALTSLTSKLCNAIRNFQYKVVIALNLQPAYNYNLQLAGNQIMPSDPQLTDAENDDGIVWMAAPKKKTSHRKKRLRNQNKALRPMRNIERCYTCGNMKLSSIYCFHCLQVVKEKTREYRKSLKPLVYK